MKEKDFTLSFIPSLEIRLQSKIVPHLDLLFIAVIKYDDGEMEYLLENDNGKLFTMEMEDGEWLLSRI